VTHSDKAELRKLIETEIAIGFTMIDTAVLSGAAEHKKQAIDNATAAHDNASCFMHRFSADDIDPSWESKLAELRAAIDRGRFQ
jgi:hypothetical protein